jgi:hypothetical protein
VSFGGGDRLAVAAIDDLIDEDMRRLRQVGRLGQCEGCDVLDFAARVAWRQRQILDDRVLRVSRIDFAVDPSANQLERSCRGGGLSVVHRLPRSDFEPYDLRRNRRRAQPRGDQ